MVQCDVEKIERVHPMPGNYWVVSFTTEDLAEEAQNGFILKEKRIHPVLMAQRFVTATVAYVMLDATLGDIERALERYAEVISIKDLHVRDFPSIKNGKQRAGKGDYQYSSRSCATKLPSSSPVGWHVARTVRGQTIWDETALTRGIGNAFHVVD